MPIMPAAVLGLAASLAAAPLAADPIDPCSHDCVVTLTAPQLLAQVERLVAARRFDVATPLVAALGQAPGYALQAHFLAGYVAVETGALDEAIGQFRAALAIDPKQTRVRLELARAMMLRGRDGAADYNYRLAQQAGDLPDEIAATIRASRGILRDRRPWHVSSSFGFAPDTNINNGSDARVVDVVLGSQTLPLTLNPDARARSGVGQTGSLSAGYRFKLPGRAALLLDADGQGTNYDGTTADDYTLQLAAGPEFRPDEALSLSAQSIALQRWYGGRRAATQFGLRLSGQRLLDSGARAGLTLDARHTDSGFGDGYSGWNVAAYATFERVVARSMIASASVFARTDRLNEAAYSSNEIGLSLGIGGELAHGINAGVSASAGHSSFLAPMLALGASPRVDWRLSGRVYAGLRSLRVIGFSPSVSYSYARTDSSLSLYDSRRSRFDFALARYF